MPSLLYICHHKSVHNMSFIPQHLKVFSSILHNSNMETEEYWPMAQEYGIWNAAIASLQFWAEDLDPVTLGKASERVYYHFFWTSTSHTLCQLSEEVLFGHFVLALNAAFTQQLSLEDEGYESGSNEDVPTPLHKMPCIHYVSSLEHASFNPIHSTPCRPASSTCNATCSPARSVRCCLSFSDASMDTSPSSSTTSPEFSDNEEEDFQTVSMDDEHWTTDLAPERTFCIHEKGLPNNICSYPCPYGSNNNTMSYLNSLDLSDVSDLEDHFLTTSDEEELPELEEG